MPMPIESPPPSAPWTDIRRWRKCVREELIQRRTALSGDTRRTLGKRACARMTEAVDLRAFEVLGFCWPIRGEFDVTDVAKQHLACGGQIALPVVVAKSSALEFWRWYPGMPMRTGIWNIPIPREREVLMPNVVIAPLVGFDESGFRLGYGGGYFDRTLAAASPRPFAIGIGYADSALPTIYPQVHDIPMNLIVNDAQVSSHSVTCPR
jgi:5-formyltetrahydrofolate cyclo-ligase